VANNREVERRRAAEQVLDSAAAAFEAAADHFVTDEDQKLQPTAKISLLLSKGVAERRGKGADDIVEGGARFG
jgi:hypothetical protein